MVRSGPQKCQAGISAGTRVLGSSIGAKGPEPAGRATGTIVPLTPPEPAATLRLEHRSTARPAGRLDLPRRQGRGCLPFRHKPIEIPFWGV
jgi:hypothetical protein